MKTNEIILALGLPATKQRRAHASTLADIYKHLDSIKNEVLSVDILDCEFALGRESELIRKWGNACEIYVKDKGEVMPGERWAVKTATGSYTVSLPKSFLVYNAFAALFPSFITPITEISVTPDNALVLGSEVVSEIQKAMRFIKLDSLATWANCVCVRVKNGIGFIIGTDRHIIYKSLPIAIDFKDGDVLLHINDLKRAFQKNKKSLSIEVYSDKVLLNGVQTVKQDFEAPNYDSVIPDYTKSVEVNRKQLINAVSLISLSANRVTKQVHLHINGSIEVSAEDLDFSHESSTIVKYVQKDTIDFDYSVSGKYLVEALKALDSPTVEIYSDGAKDKCIRVGNKSEVAKILIMPLMTSDYNH